MSVASRSRVAWATGGAAGRSGKEDGRTARVLLLWSAGCAAYVWAVASRPGHLGHVELSVLWMYWQPALPPLLMLWLWGAAVRRMTQLAVDYEQCFAAKDRKYLLDGAEVQKLALVLLVVVCTTAALYVAAASRQLLLVAETLPMLLYCALAGVTLMPTAVLHRPSRHFFANTCKRVLLPLQEVSWADFLLADIFCSLSKSTADMTGALCHGATGPVMQSLVHARYEASGLCGPSSALLLAAPCLPYALRLVQCLIVNRTTGNTAQLFNAAKYCSSFPALVLTGMRAAARAQGQPFAYPGLWLVAALLNTLYSFYWDVEHDWDMPWLLAMWRAARAGKAGAAGGRGQQGQQQGQGQSSQDGSAAAAHALRRQGLQAWLPSLRPDALYRPTWYTWALISNLVLRCAWLHRLIEGLESSRQVGLVLACLEVWRRYQWSFIRVETELRKITARSASAMTLDDLMVASPAPSTNALAGAGSLLHHAGSSAAAAAAGSGLGAGGGAALAPAGSSVVLVGPSSPALHHQLHHQLHHVNAHSHAAAATATAIADGHHHYQHHHHDAGGGADGGGPGGGPGKAGHHVHHAHGGVASQSAGLHGAGGALVGRERESGASSPSSAKAGGGLLYGGGALGQAVQQRGGVAGSGGGMAAGGVGGVGGGSHLQHANGHGAYHAARHLHDHEG